MKIMMQFDIHLREHVDAYNVALGAMDILYRGTKVHWEYIESLPNNSGYFCKVALNGVHYTTSFHRISEALKHFDDGFSNALTLNQIGPLILKEASSPIPAAPSKNGVGSSTGLKFKDIEVTLR